jgi:hypothetical protein
LTDIPKRCSFQSVINETELTRALVATVHSPGMDLTKYGTEADIAAAIQKRLKG